MENRLTCHKLAHLKRDEMIKKVPIFNLFNKIMFNYDILGIYIFVSCSSYPIQSPATPLPHQDPFFSPPAFMACLCIYVLHSEI